MLKIAYLYHRDAANAEVQSGRPASILHQLRSLGVAVENISPLNARHSRTSFSKKLLYRLAGNFYRGDREPRYLAALAGEARGRMEGKSFDAVFSPGSEVVAALEVDIPVSFCADATFANMVNYYWDFSRVSAEYLRKGHAQESAALRRASLAVYPSEWAARSATEFYGIDPKRVAVIPFGANLGAENGREEVERWIGERPRDFLRLVFVGRDWKRKGGDLVIAAAAHLVAQGIRVELDLVGCEVPRQYQAISWIKTHGLLRPSVAGERLQLCALFAGAHFAFIPSRAEAYGMTFAEANAFGVPVISTSTGGITSIVRPGVNGYLLPLNAEGPAYAEVIAAAYHNPGEYTRLARASFQEFESRLNWRIFCTRYLEAAARMCGLPPRGRETAVASDHENRLCR